MNDSDNRTARANNLGSRSTFVTYRQVLETVQRLVKEKADELKRLLDTNLATNQGSDRLNLLTSEVASMQMALLDNLEIYLQQSSSSFLLTYTQFTSPELVNLLNKPASSMKRAGQLSDGDQFIESELEDAVALNKSLAELFGDLQSRADHPETLDQLCGLRDMMLGYNKRMSASFSTIDRF